MNGQDLWRLAKSDYVIVVPVLVLAFYMAFIPHINYPYAVHIDECPDVGNADTRVVLMRWAYDYVVNLNIRQFRGCF